MKAAVAKEQQNGLDLVKLEQMIEPFEVRVERQRGNVRTPIPLPPSEDGTAAGTGWTKDQVRGLEQWLVKEWSGGGLYHLKIIDATVPIPQSQEWKIYYETRDFPERIPPILTATSPIPPPSPIGGHAIHQPQPTQVRMATFPGGGLLPPAAVYGPTAYPQPPQVYPQQGFTPLPQYVAPQYPAPMYGGRDPMWEIERQRLQDELRATREAAQKSADSQSIDRRFAELQQSISQLAQALTAKAQTPAVDPAVNELREQNRRLEEEIRRQRDENERNRRDQELRDQMHKSQEQTNRAIEAAERRYQELVATTKNSGPDPAMLMYQENMRMQVEAMKELARQQQTSSERMLSIMMRPQDVISMVKDSSHSADQVAAQMNRAWSDMFSVSRQLIEQAAQLNQGGSEVIGLIRDIGGKAEDMFTKYVGNKAKEHVAEVQAQAQVATAQAAVITAQNERLGEMARAESDARRQAQAAVAQAPRSVPVPHAVPVPQPVVPTPANGTNGANGGGTVVHLPWVHKEAPPSDSGLAGAQLPQEPSKPKPQEPSADDHVKRRGRSDIEWFGITLPRVKELRAGVKKLIDGLSETPRRIDPEGFTAEVCAAAIHQAALEVMQRQLPIPALVDLLLQGCVADFVDILLPDAPQGYKDEVAQLLMSGKAGEIDLDGDEDEDDEDEDDGDEETQSQPSA